MSAGCDDCRPPADVTSAAPDYRRALWTVGLLNLAMGVAEVVGGLLAGSQAVKADALDFLGDGAITLIGLVTLGKAPTLRARAALLQGVFLAVMGAGAMASTIYRVWAQQLPEAQTMGWLGAAGFAVNVLCASLLIPYRRGDVNVRAIWLFSRNDALGNLAVVAAAALVGWTGTPWPDLVVAGAVAALFLHSAMSILSEARRSVAMLPHAS